MAHGNDALRAEPLSREYTLEVDGVARERALIEELSDANVVALST